MQYLCAACFWEAIPLDKRCPCVDNAAMAAKHDESRRSKIGTQLHPSALVASSSPAASSSSDRMEDTADAVMRTPPHALDSKMLLQLVHGQKKLTQELHELKKDFRQWRHSCKGRRRQFTSADVAAVQELCKLAA